MVFKWVKKINRRGLGRVLTLKIDVRARSNGNELDNFRPRKKRGRN